MYSKYETFSGHFILSDASLEVTDLYWNHTSVKDVLALSADCFIK